MGRTNVKDKHDQMKQKRPPRKREHVYVAQTYEYSTLSTNRPCACLNFARCCLHCLEVIHNRLKSTCVRLYYLPKCLLVAHCRTQYCTVLLKRNPCCIHNATVLAGSSTLRIVFAVFRTASQYGTQHMRPCNRHTWRCTLDHLRG